MCLKIDESDFFQNSGPMNLINLTSGLTRSEERRRLVVCLASQEEPAGPSHGDPGHGDPSPLMVAASRLEVCADQFTDLVVESVLKGQVRQ